MAGIVFRKRRFSSIAFASGLILALINTPAYPLNYYVRFILMASLLIPLSLVWLINYRGKIPMLIGFLFLAILAVSAVLTADALTKATLRPGEYRELESALNKYIPEGSTVLVARPMFRYWVEAISAPKYDIISPKNFVGPRPHYVVGELGRDPIPPFGRIIFRGDFIWIIKVP